MTNETPIFVVDDDDAVRESLKALLETEQESLDLLSACTDSIPVSVMSLN